MKVLCRTNLDVFNEKWPTELPALPNIGDSIESKTKHGSFMLQLEVIKITWRHDFTGDGSYYPQIELHMTNWQRSLRSRSGASDGSIIAFYEWYAPLVGRSVSSFI